VRSHILRIFSLPCGAIGFASQQHSLRLTSACNMHTQHVWSRHEPGVPGPGSVCNITINNACNGITVHTRAVTRSTSFIAVPTSCKPRLLRMPYLLVPNVLLQQFWHFPSYHVLVHVIQDFTLNYIVHCSACFVSQRSPRIKTTHMKC